MRTNAWCRPGLGMREEELEVNTEGEEICQAEFAMVLGDKFEVKVDSEL